MTTEVNGRSLPALATRSSPMAWRLGQSQTPRLQAGEAPSMPGGYPAPRAGAAGGAAAANAAGRYGNHPDPSRFVYSAPLRRSAGGRGPEQGERGGGEGGGGKQMEVAGYMSDGDVLGKNGRMDEITSG